MRDRSLEVPFSVLDSLPLRIAGEDTWAWTGSLMMSSMMSFGWLDCNCFDFEERMVTDSNRMGRKF